MVLQLNIDKYISDSIKHFKDKADHNKAEALWSFRIIMISSLATPLLISLNDDNFWGKVVPAILSSFVALGTTWLQKRQPQQLWKLYRSSQRKIEIEEISYRFEVDDYENVSDKEKMLVKKINQIKLDAHNSWESLVPAPTKDKSKS